MKAIKIFFILVLIFLSDRVFSQKWTQGKDLTYLREPKEIYLKFNYDRMKYEDLLLMKRIWKQELIRKNAKAEVKLNITNDSLMDVAWTEEWEKKKRDYQAKFETNFNLATGNILRLNQTAKEAKYTLLVNVLRIYSDSYNGGPICDLQVLIFQSIYPTWTISEAEMITDPAENFKNEQAARIAGSLLFLTVMVATKSPAIRPFPSPYQFTKIDLKYHKFSSGIQDRFAGKGWDLGTEIIENR